MRLHYVYSYALELCITVQETREPEQVLCDYQLETVDLWSVATIPPGK